MSRRRRLLAIAAVALAVGVASWAWGHWMLPGRAIVRGHVGDAGAAALAYAAIGLAARWPRWATATAALAVALAIEIGQRGVTGAGAARALVLGAHFDPWDLAAYAAGVTAATAADLGRRRRAGPVG